MKLLAELKRRNVLRMAGLYLVGAWLVVQVASTVFPAFGLPDWALRGVILLLAIGFVPALVFSWVFELTPGGLKRDDDVGAGESIAPQTARRMDRALIVVLLLALGYFAVDKFVLGPSRLASGAGTAVSTPGGTPMAAGADAAASGAMSAGQAGSKPADSKSIAVLAFADLSQAKDQEYFSDGVAEEILNALAKVEDLKVAGRTSSFYFKGRNEALAAIGSTLGVAHVLEGSVRKQGDRLRISAKLLRVGDGVELWSETFDGTDGDIFALQESIARQVASQLKVALNAGQRDRLVDAGTTNPVAYALYLRATDVFNRRASGELLSAIALVDEAIQLDPGFARAYSRMAALYALKPEYLGSDLDDSLGTAEKLARQALELQPAFSEPHAVMGYISHLQRRFLSARAEFEQALAIDPDDPLSNFWFSVTLVTGGYLTTGAEQLDRTLAIDPLLPNALHHRGRLMEWMGDLEGARRLLERARSVGAQNIGLPLGQVSQRQGRMDEALAEMSAGIQFFSPGLPEDTGAVLAGGILGDATARAAALARLHGVLETPPEVVPGIVPWALITLGEPDEGLRVVVTLPISSNVWHAALWSPRGQAVRTSPAFPEFARKVGFAELWDKHGPPDLCQKNDQGDYVCR
jgi:TolB-like protein/Tfp pilus assembly protein PilF